MPPLARLLVGLGLVLVVLGLTLWLVPGASWLGRLPGDLRIERPNLRVYVPLTTSVLVSVLLSALFWLVSRLR
jgi:ribose/xylose/arabinose/galactoside ABC-type transport system permease subunit